MSTRTVEVAIAAAKAWSAVVHGGATLEVLAGEAWLTFEGDPVDHVLVTGAAFVAPRRGRVAVLALGTGTLRLRLVRHACRAAPRAREGLGVARVTPAPRT